MNVKTSQYYGGGGVGQHLRQIYFKMIYSFVMRVVLSHLGEVEQHTDVCDMKVKLVLERRVVQ